MIAHEKVIREITRRDPRYGRECYYFVSDALEFTARELGKDLSDESEQLRHVTGKELLEGIRALAKHRFGLLAAMVFGQWGVRSTEDFGRVVFNMVEAELMRKQESDSLDDFKDGFDFTEAFEGELDLEIVD